MPLEPIVKWAGGKRRYAKKLVDLLYPRGPEPDRMYIETFAGGLAVYAYLYNSGYFTSSTQRAVAEANPHLRNMYVQLRDNPLQLMDAIEGLHNDIVEAWYVEAGRKSLYYGLRDRVNATTPVGVDAAADFIALNRTCFNGLWRTNKAGKFNVPIGSYKNPPKMPIIDAWRLAALENTYILKDAFFALEHAPVGSITYSDPPYLPASSTAKFASYTAEVFGPDEWSKLANSLRDLAGRHVVSAAEHPDLDDIMGPGWEKHIIAEVRRTVGAKGSVKATEIAYVRENT